uniref:Uncharacterized protein n=1 Tax=Panagrolaimus superbus TaxID=310955 RepID=A0A914XW93_9BILA
MHESVALAAVVVDDKKPSEFAWEAALSDTILWLHDQGDGLSLNLPNGIRINMFFQIKNLSCDLAVSLTIFKYFL